MEYKLVGYLRKTDSGKALKLSLDVESLAEAQTYKTNDGREYITLISNIDKVSEILEGEREVTSICYMTDE